MPFSEPASDVAINKARKAVANSGFSAEAPNACFVFWVFMFFLSCFEARGARFLFLVVL